MEMVKLNGKKGQEEIMGFLLIVVMIIIIGVALLFFLRPKASVERDLQIDNLLYSVLSTSYDGQQISSRIENCERGFECEELGIGLDRINEAVFTRSGIRLGQNLRGYSLNLSGGVEYFVYEGNLTGNSRGSAVVISDTLIRMRFYL